LIFEKKISEDHNNCVEQCIEKNNHEILKIREISSNIISKRYFSERREFNDDNSGFRYNRRDNNRGDNNRSGDSYSNRREPGPGGLGDKSGRPPYTRVNRDKPELGERTAFIARTLPPDQQKIVAENKFSQFVQTTPDDVEARRKISIAIMSNFAKNENSHSALIFFNKLLGLNKEIVSLTQAHYAIAIKEQLKLGEEAAALQNYASMKKSGVPPDERMIGSLLFFGAKSSPQLVDILAADIKQYNLVLPVFTATNVLISLLRDREYPKAQQFYVRLVAEFGVIPDARLQGIWMSLLLREEEDKTGEAITLFNKLRAEHAADINIYLTLVKGLVFRKQYDNIDTIMKNMKADGIQPNFRLYMDFVTSKDPIAFDAIQKNL